MITDLAALRSSLTWTILSGCSLTIGDIVLRSWFETKWPFGFTFTFAIYCIGIFFMMLSFFEKNIALATILVVITNALSYLIVAYTMYGDTINHRQIIGMLVGILAIVILESA